MIEVVRDRLVQRRRLGVDQEVMVAGVSLVDPCRCHSHVDETKANGRILRKNRAILQPDEVELGVTRRWRTAAGTRTLMRGTSPVALRHVVLVAHEQLQRVLAGLERYLSLGLASPKVEMIQVVGDWLVERR